MTRQPLAEPHRAVLGRQHRAEQDAAVGPYLDIAAEHGGRCDVRGRIDARARALVLDQHVSPFRGR